MHMKNKFVRKAISVDLDIEIENVLCQIKKTFNIELSKIQSSKIIAWKAKTYKPRIDSAMLMQILGGKI